MTDVSGVERTSRAPRIFSKELASPNPSCDNHNLRMYLTNKLEPKLFGSGEKGADNWSASRYRAAFSDGVARFIDGISNGSFGLSGDYVLTHLATGFKIARFQNERSGKMAGDYLREAYAEEFAALAAAIEPSMTWEHYKTLPSVKTLNAKIQADVLFNALLIEYEFREPDNRLSTDHRNY